MIETTGLQSLMSAIIAANEQQRQELLKLIAHDVRLLVLDNLGCIKIRSVDEEFSICDILTALFFSVLHFDPVDLQWPQRDRLILSKGTCSVALYAVLGQCGFIPVEELASFMGPAPHFNGQPNHKIPGVEAGPVPLGQGLSIGIKCSTAARLSGDNWRTFVVLDDGELQEGSTWEAATEAVHHALSKLTVIVDCNWAKPSIGFRGTNQLQQLANKWVSLGWSTVEIDGHDFEQLYTTLSAAPGNQPRCIIAQTQKGHGK